MQRNAKLQVDDGYLADFRIWKVKSGDRSILERV
jgi:hypothetical protein